MSDINLTTVTPVGSSRLAEIMALVGRGSLSFPSPPLILVRINSILNDDASSVGDIAKAIQVNPVLSMRLLKVVNSALFRRSAPILSLSAAISQLGISLIKNISLAMAIKDTFKGTDAATRDIVETIWASSIEAGLLSFLIATKLRTIPKLEHHNISPDVAMLVGIVHSIGSLPLLSYLMLKGEVANYHNVPVNELRALSISVLRSWDMPSQLLSGICPDCNLPQAARPNPNPSPYNHILKFVLAYQKGDEDARCYDIDSGSVGAIMDEYAEEASSFHVIFN